MQAHSVLLLNAANMAAFPVYPYAFIQVPAVARQSGIQVICQDLLGVPHDKWGDTLQSLIDLHDPAMLLITLRNTDSLTIQDYEPDETRQEGHQPYFPVERTRELMAVLRNISTLKIAVGGFGFSLLAGEMMETLCPDFGVFGGPDGFFAHFEAIQAGEFASVPNLLYYQGERLVANPRQFYPPLAETEYTPQAIQDMMAFYDAFPAPGFHGAPLEIMRGCPHACMFCAEPHVAGQGVRYRDLSVVMEDVQILVENGVTKLHMISSELNPEGNQFVLELADRLRGFNGAQAEDRQVTWFGANYLLNFSPQEYERLQRSGFTGGWFDVTALDDENASTMRTPYRNKTLIGHLKAYAQFKQAHYDLARAGSGSQEGGGHDPPEITWTMFLGNPGTTVETIRKTLQVASQNGLAQSFTNCGVNTNIRVFDYEKPDPDTLAVTCSIAPNLERTAYRQIWPSFAYPPALLRHFGSETEIERLFKHLGETYLSTNYQDTRDWLGFIRDKASPGAITSWLATLGHETANHLPQRFNPEDPAKTLAVLENLFLENPTAEDAPRAWEDQALQVVEMLLSSCLDAFPDVFKSLGLPSTLEALNQSAPYDLAAAIFSCWKSEAELLEELAVQAESLPDRSMVDCLRFCIQALIYRFNLRIDAKYRTLFVSDDPGPHC